ncbi:heterokaryon incompatibility protein-domain-containing protein [Trametes meyenii]|nr:heterokaryon incompatibility protein-domain-containing protein [Trametes meyenii]
MWLLNTRTYKLRQFSLENAIDQKYAILSHCWDTLADPQSDRSDSEHSGLDSAESESSVFTGPGFQEFEVTFADIQDLSRARMKPGWAKVQNACAYARRLGLKWLWDDTCCINKESSAELSEAINSMFAWYRHAHVCLIFLSDVPSGEDPAATESSFRNSRWFKRGWTLQELIASNCDAVFLSDDWTEIGICLRLASVLEEITGIDRKVLTAWHHDGRIKTVHEMSIAKRMSWAADRETTREEDRAYSLMGLFDVHMPVIYGEGGEKAFRRLQSKIIKKSTDHSIFAYGQYATIEESLRLPCEVPPRPEPPRTDPYTIDTGKQVYLEEWSFPSPSPDSFEGDTPRSVETMPVEELSRLLGLSPPPDLHYVPTNQGVRIALPIACVDVDRRIYLALLALRPARGSNRLAGMLLRRQEKSDTTYRRLARHCATRLMWSYARQVWVELGYTEGILIDTSTSGITLPGGRGSGRFARQTKYKWEMKTIYILP